MSNCPGYWRALLFFVVKVKGKYFRGGDVWYKLSETMKQDSTNWLAHLTSKHSMLQGFSDLAITSAPSAVWGFIGQDPGYSFCSWKDLLEHLGQEGGQLWKDSAQL